MPLSGIAAYEVALSELLSAFNPRSARKYSKVLKAVQVIGLNICVSAV